MQILMFWLDRQHANIVLHLIMQYKPHPWNHPWDLAPDRWKNCPKGVAICYGRGGARILHAVGRCFLRPSPKLRRSFSRPSPKRGHVFHDPPPTPLPSMDIYFSITVDSRLKYIMHCYYFEEWATILYTCGNSRHIFHLNGKKRYAQHRAPRQKFLSKLIIEFCTWKELFF